MLAKVTCMMVHHRHPGLTLFCATLEAMMTLDRL